MYLIMYLCVYIYIYIHNTYVYMYICIRIYVHAYMYKCISLTDSQCGHRPARPEVQSRSPGPRDPRLWAFIKGGCSRRGVRWMGVVLYSKTVCNIM